MLVPRSNRLRPVPPEERWAEAHHRRITIPDSSDLQNEKHMEIGALKNTFGHSGYAVFASDVTGIIALLLSGV